MNDKQNFKNKKLTESQIKINTTTKGLESTV